ncbi:ROK family transcriptional regulator [Yinghuangia seranimata]|uniref:ROK family transcriptional regulator n=1 Tax=Yinghuangia seranimata TaxID=408067 RepID=UPI00248C094C|nr:ROK family transcriptional regulator [Yinghuangia seranimata]MDI2126816.1 ROK family transcriptional regulator [Yinghuangia seranimata]
MPPASPSTARAHNDRLALRLLQQQGPLTAGQLKDLTGLSRPTVADLVDRLQSSGLIHDVGESATGRRGPNARLYGIVADVAHLAALDVRTETVSVVVTDLLGTRLGEATAPIDAEDGIQAAVDQTLALVESAVRDAGATRLHSIGIGAPGLIDPATGELRQAPGLPAWHRSLAAALRVRLGATVRVENETNLAALAERRNGVARDIDTFVLMWLANGIGAAVILDGELRRGASGGAGELGFLPVPGTDGLPSRNGCEGGYHSLVGNPAVCELAEQHGLGHLIPSVHSAHDEAVEPLGATLVRAARHAGPAGSAFLDEFAARLALGVSAVAAVLDPGCVVLAGELGHAGGTDLAARVQAKAAALSPVNTVVRATTLGGSAILQGALYAAQQAAQDALFPSGD